MRRKDREITDENRIAEIISNCHCCRLAFNEDAGPYIVPLNFGFERIGNQFVFYFHSAQEGRKIELIKRGKPVGFELDTNYKLKEAKRACGYTASFQSVIGTGEVEFVNDDKDKTHALSLLMFQETGKKDWEFSEKNLNSVAIFKLIVKELSCKEHE